MYSQQIRNQMAERAKVFEQVRCYLERNEKQKDPLNDAAIDRLMQEYHVKSRQINEAIVAESASAFEKDAKFENYIRTGKASGIKNAMGTGSGSAGYLVPEQMHDAIVRIMYNAGSMMQIADVIPIKSTLNLPVDADAATSHWISEAGAFTESSPTITRIQLTPHKVGCLLKVSDELMADTAFDIEQYITNLTGTSMGRLAENEFINGTESERPLGILGSATMALTSSVTNSFNYANIITLYNSIKTPYRSRASWLIGEDALTTVMGLTDGDGRLIFQPSFDAGAPDLLLGKPLHVSESMPAITTGAKGILFGDFKNYKIGVKTGTTMKRLNELYAETGQVGIRTQMRVDGKLALAEAVKYMTIL